MAIFQNTAEFSDLVEKYGNLIYDGQVGEREITRREKISRHKVRIIRDYVLDNWVEDADDEEYVEEDVQTGSERMRIFNRAAQEVMEMYEGGFHEGEAPFKMGVDSPELLEVKGISAKKKVDIDELIAKAAALFESGEKKEKARRNQKVVVSGGPACLYFSGDEHFGGKTDIMRMLREATLVKNTPGMFHVRMGDIVNQFILGRMRAIRDNASVTIEEEWILAKMLIDTIADKLVAFCGGNHDDWARKASGMDRLADIIPDGVIYDKYEIAFDLQVGEAVKRIRIRHRWKGSSVFNPTHGIEVAAQRDKADFDVAVGAHTHQAALSREFFAQGKKRIAVLTNTFKKHDDFAREIGFPRSDETTTGVAVIFEEDGTMLGAPSLEWAANYMKMRQAVEA